MQAKPSSKGRNDTVAPTANKYDGRFTGILMAN